MRNFFRRHGFTIGNAGTEAAICGFVRVGQAQLGGEFADFSLGKAGIL